MLLGPGDICLRFYFHVLIFIILLNECMIMIMMVAMMKKTFEMIILVSFMRHCDNFDDANNDNDHNADYMDIT